MTIRPSASAPGSIKELEVTAESVRYDIEWRSFTIEERLHILQVLRRDVDLRRAELERIR